MPTNCCKKWVDGKLLKYYTKSGCGSGAVMCSEPDPPKPEGGIGEKSITDVGRTTAGITGTPTDPGDGGNGNIGHGCYPGFDWDEKQQRCVPRIPHCEDGMHWDKLKKTCVSDTVGCEPGFKPGPDGECIPDTDARCDHLGPGFRWSDRENRCIPISDQYCEPPYIWDPSQEKCVIDPDPKSGESPCGTGGYQLTTEVGFAGGVGDRKGPWDEVPGTERSHKWEAHKVWDPNKNAYVDVNDPQGQTFDLVCKKGWVRKPDAEGNTWCCPEGGNGNGDGDGIGGEFEWTEGLQGLLGRIQERANYLLDYPRGLTPQERQSVINYSIESVKAGEGGRLQSSKDALARAGLLGGGFQFEESARIKRETRGQETQIRRELGINELDRRFGELMGTTGMVQGLTGTLMQGEQIPEILSGARRSEGQAAINALLSLFGGSMGGQGNQYWQSIINQLMGNQGGSGIMDWLPWLLANQGGA